MQSSLDERLGVNVDIRHPVIAWMCEFVSFMMNRMDVATDDSVRESETEKNGGLGLGVRREGIVEASPWRTMEKLNARWGYGLSVGVKVKSNELITVDQDTKMLKYARTVRRAPRNQRWDPANLAWAEMVPWNRG